MEVWQEVAGMKTYGDAVAEVMSFRASEGERFEMTVEQWYAFARRASLYEAREKARAMGIQVVWDCELPKTPDGFYQIQGGIDYAIAKSLAVAPFADLLWMETKTADLHDAKKFADAIHAEFPDKMLAYNLSPSFNWDTTGMSDEEMRRFPEELGKLGFVFDFITYGGHQIDGLASEEFSAALKQDGMLALARLQRKFRLVESPYRTPQTLVGRAATRRRADGGVGPHGRDQGDGEGVDAVPAPGADGGADRSCSRSGSRRGARTTASPGRIKVELRPHTAGSELLELRVLNEARQNGRQRDLRAHPRPARAQPAVDPRSEHGRRRCGRSG